MGEKSTKSKLLTLLEERRGEVLSGEEIAAGLTISRAAVWKAASALREQGIVLESVPGKGYCLPLHSDVMSLEGMAARLPGVPLRVLDEVDSTNLEAKRWSIEGAPHGSVVLAGRQTAGRGRLGRSFASPAGGMYLSVVLRPRDVSPAQAVLVTAAAAVAVCCAVEDLCKKHLGIKWVNDLYWQGKKCCGILSEAGTGFENGSIEYIVVGIGVNYTTPLDAFAGTLEDVATSLFANGGAPVPRADFAARVYKNLMSLFEALPKADFMDEYRRRSIVLGRDVTVMSAVPYTARAVNIDQEGHLLVQRPEGKEISLSSGEISIKL